MDQATLITKRSTVFFRKLAISDLRAQVGQVRVDRNLAVYQIDLAIRQKHMSDRQVKNICAGALFVTLRRLRQVALPLLVNHQTDDRVFDDQFAQVHLAVENGNDLYSNSG